MGIVLLLVASFFTSSFCELSPNWLGNFVLNIVAFILLVVPPCFITALYEFGKEPDNTSFVKIFKGWFRGIMIFFCVILAPVYFANLFRWIGKTKRWKNFN